MYGDLANKLVLEAKRSSHLSDLPLYQHEIIHDIVREITDLNRDVEYLNDQNGNHHTMEEQVRRVNQCQLFVTHLCLRRNKRCLLAYQKQRADKIDEFCWLNIDPVLRRDSQTATADASNASIAAQGPTHLALENLSQAEQDYYKQYQDLILDFKSTFSDIDLSGVLTPPTEIFVDVRVLKDGGEVQTEYGAFNLIKDSQFYVRKSDVDRLIQQGYLAIL